MIAFERVGLLPSGLATHALSSDSVAGIRSFSKMLAALSERHQEVHMLIENGKVFDVEPVLKEEMDFDFVSQV